MKREFFVFLRKRKLILSIGILSFFSFVFITSLSFSKKGNAGSLNSSKIQEEPKNLIKQQAMQVDLAEPLLAIEKRIAAVQKEIMAKEDSHQTESLSQAFTELSKGLSQFRLQTQQALNQSQNENQILNQKLEAMHTLILSLKNEEQKIQYLDKKALPFEIQAIDSVNEAAVLALSYHYNHVALEIGDKLAGWKVVALDYAKQWVEFDDEKGAHVQVSLMELKEKQSWA